MSGRLWSGHNKRPCSMSKIWHEIAIGIVSFLPLCQENKAVQVQVFKLHQRAPLVSTSKRGCKTASYPATQLDFLDA